MELSLQGFRDFVAAHPLGVIATVDPTRKPEAALVSFAATPEGDLLFDTPLDSRKVRNLSASGRVAIVLHAGDQAFQVEGIARLAGDDHRAAWAAEYAEVFPDSRATASDHTLARVQVLWLRWYDATDPEHPVVAEGAA